jgi:RNA polymerase sigma-70 factor (ECF subfamily)
MKEQEPSDEVLLERMGEGDEEAFSTLYRRRQGAIYRFALQMSGSGTVAEDVTQEVFLALIREGSSYDPARGSVAAFLYGIARNHVLRALERCRAELVDPSLSDQLQSNDDPLGDLTRSERIESVREAVLALPPRYREAVVLCDLHEMSYQEAAAVLGCAVGTVRSRLHRGRAMLAAKLRPRQKTEAARTSPFPARCPI